MISGSARSHRGARGRGARILAPAVGRGPWAAGCAAYEDEDYTVELALEYTMTDDLAEITVADAYRLYPKVWCCWRSPARITTTVARRVV